MTQGVTNRPGIDPSQGVPYTKVEEIPNKSQKISGVAAKALEQIKEKKPPAAQKKSWSLWSFVCQRGLKHYFEKIDAVQDRKDLHAIFGDTSHLDEEIQQNVPFLREFIAELFLSKDHFLGQEFQDHPEEFEQFINHLVHHIILNVAIKTLSPELQKMVKNGESLKEKLQVEEVIAQFVKQSLQIFGPDFNEIDKKAMKGAPLDAKLFRNIVRKFYEYLFPKGDSIHTLIDDLSSVLTLFDRVQHPFSSDSRTFEEKAIDITATQLGALYQPLFDRMRGMAPPKQKPTPPLPGKQESLDWGERFFFRSIAAVSKKEDVHFLKSLGIPDPEGLIQQISPVMAQNLLQFLPMTPNEENGQVADQLTQALLLHAVASVAKAMGKKSLNPDTLLEDVFSHLAGMIREGVRSADPKTTTDPTAFSATSLKIISLFIPPDMPWVADFLERKEIGQLSSLNQFIFQMYKAKVGEKEVKERLVNRLGDQKRADQLEKFCNNLALRASEMTVDFLSNAENIKPILKTDGGEAIYLVTGIFRSKNRDLEWLGNSMVKAGSLQLLKGVTHFLEKIPKEKGDNFEDLSFASFEALLNLATQHLPSAMSQLKAGGSEEEKILMPFIQELSHLFYSPEKQEQQGTVAGSSFEQVQGRIAKELIVGLNFTLKLQNHKEENQKQLEKLYESENPTKMGDLLRHAMLQGIPSLLNVEAQMVADKLIVPSLLSYIALSDEQKKHLGESIARSLNKIGSEKLLENSGAIEFISQLSEATFLQFLLNFSEGILKLEKQGDGPPLVEDIALMGLKGLSSHLKNLGDAKEALWKQGIKKPNDEDIYRQYAAQNVLAEEIQDPLQKEAFYQKLSEQLFLLLETNLKDELPAVVAHVIEQKIVPILLSTAVTDGLSPEALHLLLSNLLEKAANSSEESKIKFSKLFPKSSEIKNRLADKQAREQRSNEQYQKDVGAVLSELIKNAVFIQPSKRLRGPVKHEGLRKAGAEAIADALCVRLQSENGQSQALFLGNALMNIILEAFPSEKNPETGKYQYGVRDKSGKLTSLQDAPQGIVSTTMEEKMKAEAEKKKRVESATKNVPKFLRRHIRLLTSSFVLDVFFRLWDRMEEKIQTKLPLLSRLLIPILDALIKVPLFSVIFIVNIATSILIRAFVRLIFHEPVQKLAENVQNATPENFIYDLFREIMQSVDRRREKN